MERIGALEPLALKAMTSLQRDPQTLAALLFRNPERFKRRGSWRGAWEALGITFRSLPGLTYWSSIW